MRRSIALMLTGLLAGTLLLTPARAHFVENTRHLGAHAWREFIRERVFTRNQIMNRFFTRNQTLARFPLRTEVHLHERTVLVPHAGTPTENGEALRQTVDAIPSASADDPWLVRLEPGTYDIGTDVLVVPSFVELEGSGRDASTILCDCSHSPPEEVFAGPGSVVHLFSSSELRSLSVVNDGELDGFNRRGVDVTAHTAPARILDVAVEVVAPVTDGTSADGQVTGVRALTSQLEIVGSTVDVDGAGARVARGIHALASGISLVVRNSEVSVFTDLDLGFPNFAKTYGVAVHSTADAHIEDTLVEARSELGTGADNYGVWNTNSHVRYVDVRSHASDGGSNWAFYNENGPADSPAVLRGIEALSIGGGDRYTAVENVDASAEISDSRLVAQGPNNISSETTGLRNRFSSTTTEDTLILVTDSTITSKGSFSAEGIHNSSSGATGDVLLIFDNNTLSSQELNFTTNAYEPTGRWFRSTGSASFITAIGGSRLVGDEVSITGAGALLSCAGVWDEVNDFFPDSCPDVP